MELFSITSDELRVLENAAAAVGQPVDYYVAEGWRRAVYQALANRDAEMVRQVAERHERIDSVLSKAFSLRYGGRRLWAGEGKKYDMFGKKRKLESVSHAV